MRSALLNRSTNGVGVTEVNTLHDLLAQAFHDNHPGQVPEDPCPTCVQQADLAVTVVGLLELDGIVRDLVAAVEDEQMAHDCQDGTHPGVEAARAWLATHHGDDQ